MVTAEFVDKYEKIYKKMNPTFCKILNETVYFSSDGFNHLLFSRGHRRNLKQIKDRLVLIPLIVPVIKNCQENPIIRIDTEVYKGKKYDVKYYTLSHLVGKSSKIIVKVVIKKRGELGDYFFQSVMRKNKKHQ